MYVWIANTGWKPVPHMRLDSEKRGRDAHATPSAMRSGCGREASLHVA